MKRIKPKYIGSSFLLIFAIFANFFIPCIQVSSYSIYNSSNSLNTSAAGVSNYMITQSVTYDVEINFSVTQTGSGTGHYYMRHPRFNDLQPNSTASKYSGPFQESQVLYSKVVGSQTPSTVIRDDYGNTFDLFNHSALGTGNSITFDQKYNITLNEVTYGDLSSLPITMNDYNTSDEMFLYFCNQTDSIYPRDNPTLITVSNLIAGGYTNPFDKVQAIINYVSSHITYNDQLGADEKGALWAQVQATGDCSEYSTLMITLLRIQGIPARKAGGFMIVQDMGYKPYVGETWTYSFDQLLAHAWVEYYIPTVGWIQCEPQNPSFVKTSSYLRMTQTLGAWFPFPYYDGSLHFYNLSEYNYLYTAYTSGLSDSYILTITVTDTNLLPPFDWLKLLPLIIILSIIGAAVVVSVIIISVIVKKSRRNKSEW